MWGHVVAEFLKQLPQEVGTTSDLLEKASFLDNFYIATRYANGHPSGAPFEHYTNLQSEQAIIYADEIVNFARIEMA